MVAGVSYFAQPDFVSITAHKCFGCEHSFHCQLAKHNKVWTFPALSATPFAVHYEKMRNHLRETTINSAKIHSLARKYEHLRINQIQYRFLHFNQHSITLLGIHMRHSAYKREKYTFICASMQVINTILKVNRDNRQTLK